MKMLLVCILTIFTSFNLSPLAQKFEENVSTYYKSYSITDKSRENEYELLISSGICNEVYSYGVYFKSLDSKKYTITAIVNDETYVIEQNSSGYVEEYRYGLYENTKLIILDEDYKKIEEINLYLINVSFENGQNQGVELSNYRALKTSINKQLLIFGISGGLIAISLIVLLVLYITRNGLFKVEKRNNDVYSIKPLIDDSEYEPFDPTSNVIDKLVEEEKIEEIKKTQMSQTQLKEHLIEKGFITEYNLVSEEEKNKIMLELMVLRNKGNISEETYKKEVVELWKN